MNSISKRSYYNNTFKKRIELTYNFDLFQVNLFDKKHYVQENFTPDNHIGINNQDTRSNIAIITGSDWNEINIIAESLINELNTKWDSFKLTLDLDNAIPNSIFNLDA